MDKHGKIYKQHNTRIERFYIITDYVCDAMYRIDLFIRKKKIPRPNGQGIIKIDHVLRTAKLGAYLLSLILAQNAA